ncbi:MAG: FAD-binding oxidoreductase [Vampirovibrionales bacterium]
MIPYQLEAFLEAVSTLFSPESYTLAPADCLVYERDTNYIHAEVPRLVALPRTTHEVQQWVRLCSDYGVPYTARGAGTGESGGSVASKGGVLVSFARMNQLISVDTKHHTARVQAGMVNGELNQALQSVGLCYRPDPSSQKACTLGGNWAENAGGLHCVKYGVTSDHVLSLQWVTPDGRVCETAPTPAIVSPEGVLDITPALVGSEGTLGLLTEATVKLLPLPPAMAVVLMSFASIRDACQTVATIMATALPSPAALELMDAPTVRCVNQAFNVGLPTQAEAVLLLEVDGQSPEEVTAQLEALRPCWEAFHPLDVQEATSSARIQQLWAARRGAAASYGLITPALYVLDPAIPRQAVADVLEGIAELSHAWGIPIANVFHAGDGNLHPHLMFDPTDTEQTEKVDALGREVMRLCLAHGGVISGEHGIGLEKVGLMSEQFTPHDLAPMYALQQAWDTHRLANPGKLLPQKHFCGEGHCQHGSPANASANVPSNHDGSQPRRLQGIRPSWLEATGLWI